MVIERPREQIERRLVGKIAQLRQISQFFVAAEDKPMAGITKKPYGKMPDLTINGPDDTGRGRWIPTTSVDEYSATLASWFGVSSGQMSTVLPNIVNYNPSTWNLGFV